MNPRRRQVANSLRRDRASSLHLSHSDAETEQYEQHIANVLARMNRAVDRARRSLR